MSGPIENSESFRGTPAEEHIQKFKKSAKLFQEALDEFTHTDIKETQKRRKFVELMQKSMSIMSETAQAACRSQKAKLSEKELEENFQHFHEDVEQKKEVGKILYDCRKMQEQLHGLIKELEQ